MQEGMIIMEGSSGPGCEVLHKMSEWLSYMLSSEDDTPPVKVSLLPGPENNRAGQEFVSTFTSSYFGCFRPYCPFSSIVHT